MEKRKSTTNSNKAVVDNCENKDSKKKDSTIVSDSKQDLNSKNYKIINKNYVCHLNEVIGSGTFGKVFYATSVDEKNEYAIKFEKSTVKSSVLEAEYDIYNNIKDGEGIPKIVWTGEYKKYKLMIMDLLGPSLDKYFTFCKKIFNPITTCLLGIEMVRRVQYIHGKGYLHRDIKPNNFMLGKFSKHLTTINEMTVYIIDFGLSKEYIDFNTKEHIPFKDNRRFIGTPRYASIGTHHGYRQSRRDDLESIAYILIYFILGELPWQGVKAKSKSEKKEKILEIKLSHNFASDKRIPKELITLLDYTKRLGYADKPDYKSIYKLLNSIINTNSKDIDKNDKKEYDVSKHVWEWNIALLSAYENTKYYEMYQEPFKKLFDGYPIKSYEAYLNCLNINYSHRYKHRIPSSSSTTSNTNPSAYNFKNNKDDLDSVEGERGLIEDFRQIDVKNIKKVK